MTGEKKNQTLKQANTLLRQGEFQQARQLYIELLRTKPGLQSVIDFNLSLAARRQRRLQPEKTTDVKIVVYTVLVGDYEPLKEPAVKDPNCTYLLFTDNPELQSKGWTVVPFDTLGLSPRRASRLPKLLPHRYLPEHDISVYLDASLKIIEPDIVQMCSNALDGYDIAGYPHFRRDCLFDEIDECLKLAKADPETTKAFRERLQKEQFPRHWGLLENAFLVRRNSQLTRRINELWFKEYIYGPERDQFSLMHVLWRATVPYAVLSNSKDFRKSPHAQWTKHEAERVSEPDIELNDVASKFTFLREYDEAFLLKSFQKLLSAIDTSEPQNPFPISKSKFSALVELIVILDCLGHKLTSAHAASFRLSNKIFADSPPTALENLPHVGYVASSAMPTIEANNVHIMKMCDALSRSGRKTTVYALKASSEAWIPGGDWRQYFGVPALNGLVLDESESSGVISGFVWLLKQALKDNCSQLITRRLEVAVLSTLLDIPTVLELHKKVPDEQEPLLEFVLRGSSLERLVVISRPLASEMARLISGAREKISVLPDGADVPDKPSAEFPLKSRAGVRCNVGYVGHLYPGKGVELLLKIARRMQDVDFHVLGGTQKDIEYWISQPSCPANLNFYGHFPPASVPGFLQSIDIAIAPFLNDVRASGRGVNISKYFSPLKIFEYMASKKPIVCSDVPVLREVLRHEENALLCNPDNVGDFVKAINRLDSNRALGEQLGNNGYACLVERYSWSKRAEKMLSFFPACWSRSRLATPCIKAGSAKSVPQAMPTVFWAYGGEKQTGWAYGINAQRISSRIASCRHIVPRVSGDGDAISPDCVVAFDILIASKEKFQKQFHSARKILRVGGPNPLKIVSGGNRSILANKLSRVDAVIALSPQLEAYLKDMHPQVTFIPNGIDTKEYQMLMRHRPSGRSLVVGMSASMSNEFQKNTKGLYFAEEACAKIGADLFVIGRGMKQIPHNRLISDFWSKIDVLLHPVAPGKEASSNVIMEALTFGVPVITTRHAGFHGVALEHGREALIVRRTVGDFVEALRCLRSEGHLWDQLRVSGRAFVERNHNLNSVAQAYEDVIIHCLARRA